jgi:predicted DNA binding CopG/RHH family protein
MKKLNKANAADIEDGGIWEKNSKAKIISRRVLKVEEQERLEEKAGLEMISLRLPVDTIKKFKTMAEKEGIKYQPFMRRVLMQYAKTVKSQSGELAQVISLLKGIDRKLAK